MRQIQRVYVIAFLLLFSNFCQAEKLITYAEDSDGKYFVDLDSIKFADKENSLISLSTRGVYNKIQSSGAGYFVRENVFGCIYNYWDNLSKADYSPDGVPLKVEEYKDMGGSLAQAAAFINGKVRFSFPGKYVHPLSDAQRMEYTSGNGNLYSGEYSQLNSLCQIVARWTHEQKQISAHAPTATELTTFVPLSKDGGVYHVQATINGELSFPFVVDSGAADVVLPQYIGKTLFASGSLKNSDRIGQVRLSLADGRIQTAIVVNLKSMSIGGVTIRNVRASILEGDGGGLLLGQSALKKLGSWRINAAANRFEINKD